MTVAEEAVLVERLLFLDDFNVPVGKTVLYNLAHNLLHRRDPNHILGRGWVYVLAKTIASTRVNAVSWNIMDDFFGKVRKKT